MGLTPASFEGSQRGRELLARISHLDTIDDRVEKLWLSDERGHDSYFLDEENCSAYARLYLDEYRRQNGVQCQACSSHARCLGLGTDGDGTPLAPFNRPLLVRLFRALPDGKGKARYFTAHLREILAALGQGEDTLTCVGRYVRPELAVEHEDEDLARLAALYGPLVTDEREVTLSAGLLQAFGYPAHPLVL
ncbi:MAG TPA: hypothetical protein ENI39_06240, partial [Anaerolineae bacterium]|nr:hypothetical protein [Anaerolineae bacterium]